MKVKFRIFKSRIINAGFNSQELEFVYVGRAEILFPFTEDAEVKITDLWCGIDSGVNTRFEKISANQMPQFSEGPVTKSDVEFYNEVFEQINAACLSGDQPEILLPDESAAEMHFNGGLLVTTYELFTNNK
jgi:hypothetical protein